MRKSRLSWRKQERLIEGPNENAPLHAQIAELGRLVGRLMLENELLKKPRSPHCGRETVLPRVVSAGTARVVRVGVLRDGSPAK